MDRAGSAHECGVVGLSESSCILLNVANEEGPTFGLGSLEGRPGALPFFAPPPAKRTGHSVDQLTESRPCRACQY